MTIEDNLKDITRIEIEPSVDHMRQVIGRRIEFVERVAGIAPGSFIQITDDAYRAIADVTKSSPGLALEVFRRLLPQARAAEGQGPYVVTEELVRGLKLTYESLCRYWDSPLRGSMRVEVKPFWRV